MHIASFVKEHSLLIVLIYFICLLPQLVTWGIIIPYTLWKKKKKLQKSDEPVSIIIAAHNEENNLPKLLLSLIQQDYPKFEIIVINDRSTDKTTDVIDQFSKKYHIVKKVEILEKPTNWNPKKNALSKGIEKAAFQNLLFIDADCWVNTTKWIQNMSSYFVNYDILLGIGLYNSSIDNWVTKLTKFETFHTALQYLSFNTLGINYMAVGRNFGYKKSIFQKANGFEKHKFVMSGDDDLLVNQMSNSQNTIGILNKDTITFSKPETTWKAWFRQKTRHVSASYHYKFSNKLLLGTLSTSHVSVYFIYLLMLPLGMANLLHLSLLFLLRTILMIVCFKKFSAIVGEKIHWWLIPILDLMLIAYQIIIGVSSVISKRKTWI